MITILLFIEVYAMNIYIRRALKWIHGKTAPELTYNLENIQRQLYFIRQQIKKNGEYLLIALPFFDRFFDLVKED